MKPVLVTICIQRPPPFNDHLVMSQLWFYHAFLPLSRDHLYSKASQLWLYHALSRDHLYSKTTFFWPKCGRLIQVSLYYRLTVTSSSILRSKESLFMHSYMRKKSSLCFLYTYSLVTVSFFSYVKKGLTTHQCHLS